MKIIGLTGRATAGKDTVARFALEWCDERDIPADRFAFADPLKRSAAAAFGIPQHAALDFCNWLKQPGVFVTAERREGSGNVPLSATDGIEVSGKRVSGREFLQFYGTEGHRDVFGPDFWVEVTERKLNEAAGSIAVAFITDPRFIQESDMIHRYDGEVWEIVRPGEVAVEAHASESGLPEGAIEFQIRNDGTLEDLRSVVRSVCQSNLEGVL